MDEELVKRMMSRFEGFHEAYGSYDPEAAKADMRGGKVEIKATAYTKRRPVTLELWDSHLSGISPLGIIPIRDNNTVLWGCIDIDLYGIDVVELIQNINDEKLPLIVCKTKSGGAHVFLFMASPVDAGQMRIGLRNIAAVLRHGNSEIFPKQDRVMLEHGDLGSWLNMPYFGEDRQAYNPDGSFMSLKEFLKLADSLEQPPNWFEQDESDGSRRSHSGSSARGGMAEFKDGPPCMQHLSAIGIGEGGRNTGIYAIGIFAKKKFPNSWEEVLESFNRDIAQPPLPATELVDIIKRLRQKEYNYPCKDQPIVAHCNSAVCRTRKYGVGGSMNEMPVISGLTRIGRDPPLWFLTVGEERMEFTTDLLMNYHNFKRYCWERTGNMFNNMKQSDWEKVLGAQETTLIEESAEVSNTGRFEEILDDFVNDEHRARQKDDILLRHAWLDDTDSDVNEHKHYFRLQDLQKYLEDAGFKIYSRGQIVSRLMQLKGGKAEFVLKKKFTRVWWVPYNFITNRKGRIGSPPLEEPPI
jgi:hypothetical protein